MSTPHVAFVATNDLVGLTRGKGVPIGELESALTSGIGWTPGNLALTAFGPIADNPFGSFGDLRLLPDPSTAITVSGDASSAGAEFLLGDIVDLDGQPWQCCPRTALRTALSEFEEQTSLRVVASFEHEFVLGGLRPEPGFSFSRLRSAEPFGSDLVQLLIDAGLDPESWLPEYGAGQFEVTLAPSDALTAADRAVQLKNLVHDLARRRGLDCSFAPMLSPDGIGNGVHVHLSLTDREGRPVLYDAERRAQLSDVGCRFAAGVLRHAAAITAWTAPSPVSFARLVPDKWSAGGVFLGERNREALLRICPTSSLSKTPVERQYNLEFRAVDATANPWLALTAIVRAGMLGLTSPYPDAEVHAQADGRPVAPSLPDSLDDALEQLESDTAARRWVCDELLMSHLSVRRADRDALAALDAATAYSRVAEVY